MDIRQLKYFLEIVNSGFNLSAAGDKLSISQPALSMLIKKFEREEKADVFVRHKGLIIGLSSAGETFYNNALRVVGEYERMYEELRHQATHLNGQARIGIPPLVLTVVCTDFLTMLVMKYEQANFTLEETGAYDLERKLLLEEIDCAVLLRPTSLSPERFREVLINKDELTAFMSKDHPLAKKELISWKDLDGQSMVIFDETYMIHHKLKHAFEEHGISVNVAMMSKSWDFLLESVRNSHYITVLPSPIRRFYNLNDVAEVHFDAPIPWEVIYVYPIKQSYSRIEQTMHDEVNHFYLKGQWAWPPKKSI